MGLLKAGSVWKQRLPYLLAGISLLFSGVDALENGSQVLGIVSMLVAMANLLAMRTTDRRPAGTVLAVYEITAIAMAVTAYDAAVRGGHYIQYGWGVAAVAYLVGGVVKFRKMQQAGSESATDSGASG